MYNNRLVTLLLIVSLFLGLAPAPAKAEGASPTAQAIAGDAMPLTQTLIELQEKTTTLNWYEERLEVVGVYKLFNPTNKKIKVPMTLPYVENNSSPPEYYPLVKAGETVVKASYNASSLSYKWDQILNAGEQLTVTVTYSLPRELDAAGLTLARYTPSSDKLWAKQPSQTTLSLHLKEIHLGQIQEIQPLSYQFLGDSLTWTWPQDQAEQILIKANIIGEINSWASLLPYDDRVKLAALVAAKDYLGAAELFRVKAQSEDRETRNQLKEVQGYYLEKANQPKDAQTIWQDLYEDKSRSPRVYWALGQAWGDQSSKIQELYQKVKEMQINPLLQEWLATKLPPTKLKPVAPENPKVAVSTEGNRAGLLLKVTVSDKDGDLQKVAFRYHWEDQKVEEKIIDLKPFQYEHNLSLFIPASGSLQRLFYEVIATDKTGNQVTTSEKEDFYLNSQLKSQPYPLQGAVLVLSDDYNQTEQDKVYKWFLSYIKMANEADFVEVEKRRPYFIFLGQNHDFISQYQGPLFIMHTPAPFNPDVTRLNVHRYFLSYWYGPGWAMLPDTELAQLGDALMLGKGRYVMVLKYLAEKDPKKFADLLATIGQGKGLQQSLAEVFQITYWEAQVWAVWFAYGNMLIAVLLIIGFAWLGKTGKITRWITYFHEKK